MKKDIYKESMNHIRFNNNFEEETLKYCKIPKAIYSLTRQ